MMLKELHAFLAPRNESKSKEMVVEEMLSEVVHP
jgi:hypothetical protein